MTVSGSVKCIAQQRNGEPLSHHSQRNFSQHSMIDLLRIAHRFNRTSVTHVWCSLPKNSSGYRVEKGVWNFGSIGTRRRNLMPASPRHLFQPWFQNRKANRRLPETQTDRRNASANGGRRLECGHPCRHRPLSFDCILNATSRLRNWSASLGLRLRCTVDDLPIGTR